MNECFVHRISGISFTFHAQRDGRSYTKLEWLFYRIFLFTLRAQRDRWSYTSTNDQCGARSGSPQLAIYITAKYVLSALTRWNALVL